MDTGIWPIAKLLGLDAVTVQTCLNGYVSRLLKYNIITIAIGFSLDKINGALSGMCKINNGNLCQSSLKLFNN